MTSTKCILVVDDNSNDVEMTLMALGKTRLPHEAVVACDGEEALDYLYYRGKFKSRTKGDPVLVLLDINMPRVNGTEVLSEIKGDARLKAIPVVMFTSSREGSDLATCYRLGANAYVVKPVDFQEFLAVINKTGAFWAGINEPPPVSTLPVETRRPAQPVAA